MTHLATLSGMPEATWLKSNWFIPAWRPMQSIQPEPQADPPRVGDPVTYRKYRHNQGDSFVKETSEIESVIVGLGRNRFGVANFVVNTLDGTRVTVAYWPGHDTGWFLWRKRSWIQVDWAGRYFDDDRDE